MSNAMDTTPPAQPYTFDLGHMLCEDTNPVPALQDAPNKEAVLQARAQSCAQALIHQLLTTCPITRAADDGNLQITLPAPHTPLPREKSLPKEKEKTKWERFAEKKGIKAKRRDGKLAYDEALDEWKPKYGYKGKSAGGVQADWITEVEEEGKGGDDKARREKKMKARRAAK